MIDFLGLYSGTSAASTTHAAKTISTKTLHEKAFVLMYGKNKLLDTKKGINGTTNKPPSTTHLNIFLFIETYISTTPFAKKPQIYYYQVVNNLRNIIYYLIRRSENFFKTDMVYLSKSGFWLGLGQVLSAVIIFASSLVFANFISKDLYGNYKFIMTVASILATFSLTGMGVVVTQGVARGYEGILKKATIATLRWSSIIVITTFATSVYYFFKGDNVLGIAILIAGLGLPINQAYSLYGSFLMGKKDFKRNTKYGIISQFFNTASVVITALLTKNIILMIFVYFVFNTLTTLWAYSRTIKIFNINNVQDHSLISYGKHLSVMSAFGTIAIQFDKILIFHYLGAGQLAVYAFAQALPDQFKGVLKNIFGIALPKYAALPESQLRSSIIKKSIQLTLITVVVVTVFIFSAPIIFKLLFPRYPEAIIYSQIYMLGLITIPGISLFNIYFQLKKATRKLYELSLISNISTLIITSIFVYKLGLKGAAVANGLSWTIMLFVYLIYFINNQFSSTKKTVS